MKNLFKKAAVIALAIALMLVLAVSASAVVGDLNGDGVVTKDDAIYLLMHTFFDLEYPITDNADYNRDGEVDKDDAIYLLMHTFFEYEYPLCVHVYEDGECIYCGIIEPTFPGGEESAPPGENPPDNPGEDPPDNPGEGSGDGNEDDEPFTDEYLIFTELEDGTYSVKAGNTLKMPIDLVIPGEHNGKAVTAIDSDGFMYCSDLESVIIPDSIKTIGDHAFDHCEKLVSATVGNGITSIGNYVFYCCTSLVNVNIPEGVKTIGDYAFYYCKSLTTINIPESVKSIGRKAFRACYGFESIIIPGSVDSIGEEAFASCQNLKSINIGNGVKTIGASAFSTCKSLTSVTIPGSIESMGEYAFEYCKGLKSVIICEGVESVSRYAFQYCEALSSVDLGSVKTIGEEAFKFCKSLESVIIPDSVKTIGEEAFDHCEAISSLTVGRGVTSIGRKAFYHCDGLEVIYYNAVEHPDLEHSESVFYGAGSLSGGAELYIGASAKNIPAYLFSDANIISVEFAEGSVCESIGASAFYGREGLTSITIPERVTSIGEYAFEYCKSLESVIIPDSVKTIGASAFSNCISLTEIYYNATECQASGVFREAGKSGDGIRVFIGDGVKNIPAYLFSDANIISVEFAEGSVCESIGASAFYGCEGLTSITIPERVTSIGEYAFEYCKSLESVIIHDSVKTIGASAFSNCISLTEIHYNATDCQAAGVLGGVSTSGEGIRVFIGANVKKIPAYIFSHSNVSSAEFADGSVCESIGDGAFYDCESLAEITVPDSVLSIGSKAFLDCESLASVTIGKDVKTIGEDVFYRCTGITEIYYNATECADLAKFNQVFYTAGQSGEGIKVFIGEGVKKIPARLFCASHSSSGPKIISVEFAEGSVCEIIGEEAFRLCASLVSITIPEGVKEIGENAFAYGTSLESISIPQSVTAIGEQAFSDCSALKDVYYAGARSQWKSIDIGEFNTSLTNATIHFAIEECEHNYENRVCTLCGEPQPPTPDEYFTFTELEDGTYSIAAKNNIPADVILPSEYNGKAVTAVGDRAFLHNFSLVSILIPESVTSIGVGAFSCCYGLESIDIPNSVLTIGNSAFSDCQRLKSVSIGNGVNSIGQSAFGRCTSLESINIPDSVENIGNSAFWDCTGLKSAFLGSGVSSIGNSAFSGCAALESINIPESVTSIGSSAFWGCAAITSITIPKNVTDIGNSAFSECSNLAEFIYNAAECADLKNNCYVFLRAGKTDGGIRLFIGADVKKIPAYLFSNSNVSSVEFTEGGACESIGAGAFSDCASLESVTIPESVTSLGEEAFYDCENLTEIYYNAAEIADFGLYNEVFYNAGRSGSGIRVVIGKNVKKIPAYLFCPMYNNSNAPKIISVEFAEGSVCESIGKRAFYDCASLESVIILGNVLSIGEDAFRNCTSLLSITIPESTVSIGTYAFGDCTSLESVNIPDSVAHIGNAAFSGCSSLKSITLGKGVTSVGKSAFSRCTSLKDVYYTGTPEQWSQITIGSYNDPLTSATIHYNHGK